MVEATSSSTSGSSLEVPVMNQLIRTPDLIDSGKLIIINGGLYLTNNTVNGVNNSAVSFGDNSPNTVTNNYNNESTDLTRNLLEELNIADISPDQKEELRELIETAHSESNSENPKKTVLKSVLDTSKRIIDTINKSPALIDAYTKWAQFFQNPPTF